MSTAAEAVEKQLQNEFDKFNNSTYSGKASLPINILELFKIGIMGMPSQYHKINGLRMKSIGEKNIDELTVGDLNEVIKVIVNTPLERFYDNFDEAVSRVIKLDKFILSFNQMVEDFQKQLQLKRTTLMDLSGINGGHVNNSVRRIIN